MERREFLAAGAALAVGALVPVVAPAGQLVPNLELQNASLVKTPTDANCRTSPLTTLALLSAQCVYLAQREKDGTWIAATRGHRCEIESPELFYGAWHKQQAELGRTGLKLDCSRWGVEQENIVPLMNDEPYRQICLCAAMSPKVDFA